MTQAGFEAARDAILREYFTRVHPIYLEYVARGKGKTEELLKDYEVFREEIHPHLSWAINQVAQLRARLGVAEKRAE